MRGDTGWDRREQQSQPCEQASRSIAAAGAKGLRSHQPCVLQERPKAARANRQERQNTEEGQRAKQTRVLQPLKGPSVLL